MVQVNETLPHERQGYFYPALLLVYSMAADDLVIQGTQGISSHGIDLVIPENSDLTNRRIN